MKKYIPAQKQDSLFAPTLRTIPIAIDPSHPMVRLADILDWDAIVGVAERIRDTKISSNVGAKPHLRAHVGAVVVRSMKSCDLRTASDLIQNYLPARYLCELHESQWTPDFRTLITSQLPTDAWHTYLGGSLVAEGILDRLMHSTHRAELRALESMRKGEQKNSENATLTPSASSTN